MPSTASQWEKYGRDDPFFGVVSADEYRRENLDHAAIERFYGSGEDWARWLEERVEIGGDALDFGCGAGRVLIPLARRCRHVTGVDVSPSMLSECRQACERRGVTNIALADDVPPRKFDFVHSLAVLQHITPGEGYEHVERIVASLAPGGSGAINLTVSGAPLTRLFYWTLKRVPLAWNAWNLVRGRRWDYPTMQMNCYRLDRVLAILAAHKITSTRTEYLRAARRTDLHAVVLLFTRA